jgi:hypothetical protein
MESCDAEVKKVIKIRPESERKTVLGGYERIMDVWYL